MDKKQEHLTVIVEKTGTGLSAYVKEIDGLTTTADTLWELKENFKEVLTDHIDYVRETGNNMPDLDEIVVDYVLDLKQFFEYFDVLNKSAFAEKYVNMNKSLFRQYTSGHASFSSEKISNISKGLHKLADELNDLTLV